MLIPEHWARAEAQVRKKSGQQFLVHSWSWSNQSLDDARARAQRSALELAQRLASEKTHSLSSSYGVQPLREEIIERKVGDSNNSQNVITRNGQGCLVLNTNRLMIVDVDDRDHKGPGFLTRLFAKLRGNGTSPKSSRELALSHIRNFAKQNSKWRYRIYETRAGLRVIVNGIQASAASIEAQDIMRGLGGDPLYIQLCKTHDSYRARLSPKPFRIGLRIPKIRYPYESEAQKQAFSTWNETYAAKAEKYSTCRWLEEIGLGAIDPHAQGVIAEHDRLTRARSSLPLA